jgi:hypothetical protein
MLWCLCGQVGWSQTATTVDGVEIRFDDPDFSTVVLYSNQQVQDKTRAAGTIFDPLQGRAHFRLVVVVDLRGSMANWVKGYTIRTIQRDLNREASRVEPFFKENGNTSDPRKSMNVVADFSGAVCDSLGWTQVLQQEQILFFPRGGQKILWKPPFDSDQLKAAVASSL